MNRTCIWIARLLVAALLLGGCEIKQAPGSMGERGKQRRCVENIQEIVQLLAPSPSDLIALRRVQAACATEEIKERKP